MKTQIVLNKIPTAVMPFSDIKNEHDYFYGADHGPCIDGKIRKYFLVQFENGRYLFREITLSGKSSNGMSLSGIFTTKNEALRYTVGNEKVKVFQFDTLKELFQWGMEE